MSGNTTASTQHDSLRKCLEFVHFAPQQLDRRRFDASHGYSAIARLLITAMPMLVYRPLCLTLRPSFFCILHQSHHSKSSYNWTLSLGFCRCGRLWMGRYWLRHGRNRQDGRQRLSTSAWYQILCATYLCRHGVCPHDAMDLCLCLSKTANHMIVREKFDRGHQMQVVSTFCTTPF